MILSKKAIVEMSIKPGASYAPFSSREKQFNITMVWEDSARPEIVGVEPDGGEDGEGNRPFAALLAAALAGTDLPPFFEVDGEDEERFVSIMGLEVLEIPMGVLFKEIYDDSSDARYVGPDSGLGAMDAAGNA